MLAAQLDERLGLVGDSGVDLGQVLEGHHGRDDLLAADLPVDQQAEDRVENPPFYPMLAGMGFSNLPDFSQMAAITFLRVLCDLILEDWAYSPLR